MADYQDSVTFAFDRAELCWPVLFHVEPLIATYPWKKDLSVKVSDDDGAAAYPSVAEARVASRDKPPHRVEFYASAEYSKAGVWVVGFGAGEQPAVTVYSNSRLTHEWNELRDSVAEFLGHNGADVAQAPAPAQVAPAARRGAWQWMTNQPMAVQIIGGVIATLLASGIVAAVALIAR
jgi:hypothetical protein